MSFFLIKVEASSKQQVARMLVVRTHVVCYHSIRFIRAHSLVVVCRRSNNEPIWKLHYYLLLTFLGSLLYSKAFHGPQLSPPGGVWVRSFIVSLLRLFINVGMTIGPAVGGFLAAVDFVWIFVVDDGYWYFAF